jgi:iron complex transport system ATP-binding protein
MLSAAPCLPDVLYKKTDDYISLSFSEPKQVISSAVLHGGVVKASHILNMRVPENFLGKKTISETPEETLKVHSMKWGFGSEECVGMMTSAHMNTFRIGSRTEEDVTVECYLTAGVSNARCAGDPAEWRHFAESSAENTETIGLGNKSGGTINIILGTNATLTPSAQVECISLISEAKADVCRSLGIHSPVTQKIATGTGTDSTAVFCGDGVRIQYAGKHVLFGEMLASVVCEVLISSLQHTYNPS